MQKDNLLFCMAQRYGECLKLIMQPARQDAINISEKIYRNNVADKINLRYCKFISGVNSKSSNIAVLSELGRYPIYFNIVLSMISYLHRLHHCS